MNILVRAGVHCQLDSIHVQGRGGGNLIGRTTRGEKAAGGGGKQLLVQYTYSVFIYSVLAVLGCVACRYASKLIMLIN